jgi:hypothetical protein
MKWKRIAIVFVMGIQMVIWGTANVEGASLDIPPSTSVSVSAWVKPLETTPGSGLMLREMGVFVKGGKNPNQGIGMYIRQNKGVHGVFAFPTALKDVYSDAVVKVTPGEWNQVGIDFDGSTEMKVWVVDGTGTYKQVVENLSSASSIKNSTRPLYIGHEPSGWISSPYFAGTMDEFTMTIGGTKVLELHMDEIAGTRVNDSSGFGNHGALQSYGMLPTWVTGYLNGGVYTEQGAIYVPHEPFLAGRIYGTVSLQNSTNHSGLVTFELRQPGTTSLIAYNPTIDISPAVPGVQVILPSSGAYQLPVVPVGTFDLAVKVSGWLRSVTSNVVVLDTTDDGITYEGTTTLVDVPLKGGDINDTNSVNIQDLNVLKANYGKSGAQ